MQNKKIIKLLDNTSNHPTKFRRKNWVETNDDARRTHSTNSQIKFKTSILKSILCDYSDAYIVVIGTITVAEVAAGEGNNNIQVVCKNCAPFTDCISEINNTQTDNAKDIQVVIPTYNLVEYSDKCSKILGRLWQ